MVTTTSPASRGLRTLSTGSVAVRRPRPVTSRAVSIRVSRPVSPRARANATGSEAIQGSQPITSRPFTEGQRLRRRPPPTLSTANGERGESENDGYGHESCPTESGLYDPSLFLDPKIGKHGRIEKGSGSPKLHTTHHVAERAAMSGEKQPRKQCGQGESAATEQPPSPQLPKELKRKRRACAQQTNVQRHFTPLAGPRSSGRRGSLTRRNTRCTPRPPPHLLSCPPEGREEEEEEVLGSGTSKEVLARGEAPAQGEQSLKGVIFSVPCKCVSSHTIPTEPETNQHKSHKSCHACIFCPYT